MSSHSWHPNSPKTAALMVIGQILKIPTLHQILPPTVGGEQRRLEKREVDLFASRQLTDILVTHVALGNRPRIS